MILSLGLLACSPGQRAALPTTMRIESLEVPGADVRWYEVQGDTRPEILASLLRNSPETGVGAHVAASTAWSLYWHVPKNEDGTCATGEATVTRDVTVELPAWQVPPTVSQLEAQAWLDYVRGLAGHEFGHVQRIHLAADALAPALHGQDCEQADTIGYAMLDQLEARNAEYDAATAYGADQGTDFWSAAALDMDGFIPHGFATTVE